MLSAVLLALAAAAVSADYIKEQQFNAPDCTGDLGASNVRELATCQPVGDGNPPRFRALTCTGSLSAVYKTYASATCTGTAVQTDPTSIEWGCRSPGNFLVTCEPGTWAAPANSLVEYSGSACPASAPGSAVVFRLGCNYLGGSYLKASCDASSYTTALFWSSDCSGEGGNARTGSIGCAPREDGGSGVTVRQCTLGASSGAPAAAAPAVAGIAVGVSLGALALGCAAAALHRHRAAKGAQATLVDGGGGGGGGGGTAAAMAPVSNPIMQQQMGVQQQSYPPLPPPLQPQVQAQAQPQGMPKPPQQWTQGAVVRPVGVGRAL